MGRGKTVLLALAAASLLTCLAWAGVLDTADRTVSDALYQKPSDPGDSCAVVGIDDRAIEELGPYNEWGRDIMAQVIECLNFSDDCHPAAIVLDVLYTGETDPDTDAWLAEAAGQYGNVVAASAAAFGNVFTPEDGGRQKEGVLRFEEPYPALRDAVEIGHINVMLDGDGILRHHLLSLDLPDGRTVPSLALAAAEKYAAASGLGPVELPRTRGIGFWYLPYRQTPGSWDENISVVDILNGEVDPETFNGRIVLIGVYTPALQDSYLTSIDHSKAMYGVEYHANAIQALLSGEYKWEVGDGVQLLALFVILFGAWLLFRKRKVLPATLLWAGICGGSLLLSLGLYAAGYAVRVLWVPAGVSVLYVVSIAANYIRENLERRKITGTFKRYVAPEIVNELLREDPETLGLGGKQVNIAVLFVDVRGFTPMSEKLRPTQVVEILNRYLSLISDCILKNGGTLDKFIGDAAMAFWGAPLPQEDYVMRAVKAARDMTLGAEELSRELQEKYGCAVAFGIGVHAGEAVVGNIGSAQRMDYTAIGDTVNTAARLEANAPAATVYISRAVADALEGRIRATSLGDSVKLKGKKEGFEVLVLDEILE